MTLVGCDLHSRNQQVAVLDTETGEVQELRLAHEGDAVEHFYASLPRPVTVGIESTGYALWFHAVLQRQGHTVLVGDAAKIRAMVVRKTKTDRRDAAHLLQLLSSDLESNSWLVWSGVYDLRGLEASEVERRHEPLLERIDVLTKTKQPELQRYWTQRDRAANLRLFRLVAEVLRAIEAGAGSAGDCPYRSRLPGGVEVRGQASTHACACITMESRSCQEVAMRTTIELNDEHRAALLRLAARRGEKGFSALIGEAVEAYLRAAAADEPRRAAALRLRGTLPATEAAGLQQATRTIRAAWR